MTHRTVKRFGLMVAVAVLAASAIVAGATTIDGPNSALALSAGSTLELQVAGVAGVPSDADAVVLNMTVVNAQAPGFATVYPCGQPRPDASNLNYVAGQTIPNLVIAKPGVGGKVCIYSYATVDVLADVAGYFPTGSSYTSIPNPVRVLDTRSSSAPTALPPQISPVGASGPSPVSASQVRMRCAAVEEASFYWRYVRIEVSGLVPGTQFEIGLYFDGRWSGTLLAPVLDRDFQVYRDQRGRPAPFSTTSGEIRIGLNNGESESRFAFTAACPVTDGEPPWYANIDRTNFS